MYQNIHTFFHFSIVIFLKKLSCHMEMSYDSLFIVLLLILELLVLILGKLC